MKRNDDEMEEEMEIIDTVKDDINNAESYLFIEYSILWIVQE